MRDIRDNKEEALIAVHLLELQADEVTPERLRAIAKERLGKRLAEPDPVLEAVAAHPNTPLDILLDVAWRCPMAFLRNPIALLATLEEPAFIGVLRWIGGSGLLRSAEIPVWLVQWLVAERGNDPLLAEDAALHISLAGECPDAEWSGKLQKALERVILASDRETQEALVELVELDLAPAWIIPLTDVIRHDRIRILMPSSALPKDQKDPVAELMLTMTGHPDWREEVWQAAASDPQTFGYGLYIMARNGSLAVRQAVAQNPATGEVALRWLAADEYASVRRAACRHPRASDTVRSRGREAVLLQAFHPEGNALCRFFALLSPQATAEKRTATANGLTFLDRIVAALTGDDTLRQTLAADGNQIVRAICRGGAKTPPFFGDW